jgi:hypothetical protein
MLATVNEEVVADNHQQVVEVMRNSAGQPPKRLEFLRL